MKAEVIQLLGLISLRALVEYDLAEYRRCADMSRRQLDVRIRSLLKQADSKECDELYDRIVDISDTSESPLELNLLMHQIYLTSSGKAQYYALQRSESENYKTYEQVSPKAAEYRQDLSRPYAVSEGDELIRLSTMLLLKDLRDYSPKFHQRIGESEIDGILEPAASGALYILMQAKPSLRNWEFLTLTDFVVHSLRPPMEEAMSRL